MGREKNNEEKSLSKNARGNKQAKNNKDQGYQREEKTSIKGINVKSRLKKEKKQRPKRPSEKRNKKLHSDPGRNYERGKKKMTKTIVLACFQEKKRQKSKPL